MDQPLIVLEGGDATLAEREAARYAARGWAVVDGFRTPAPRGARVIRHGRMSDAVTASDAMLAALDGCGLVVDAQADRPVIDRFVDDLRRIGPVDHRAGPPPAEPAPDPVALALLELLADGSSLGEAAEALGLARRTADRRLAEIRRALGTERTAEALAKARRLGWLDRNDNGRAGR